MKKIISKLYKKAALFVSLISNLKFVAIKDMLFNLKEKKENDKNHFEIKNRKDS